MLDEQDRNRKAYTDTRRAQQPHHQNPRKLQQHLSNTLGMYFLSTYTAGEPMGINEAQNASSNFLHIYVRQNDVLNCNKEHAQA